VTGQVTRDDREHQTGWYHLVAADDQLSRIVATGLRDYVSLSEQEKEFRRYIESDLMKRQPHPDAKPMGAFSLGESAEQESAR
jgi:hypothetical protein